MFNLSCFNTSLYGRSKSIFIQYRSIKSFHKPSKRNIFVDHALYRLYFIDRNEFSLKYRIVFVFWKRYWPEINRNILLLLKIQLLNKSFFVETVQWIRCSLKIVPEYNLFLNSKFKYFLSYLLVEVLSEFQNNYPFAKFYFFTFFLKSISFTLKNNLFSSFLFFE